MELCLVEDLAAVLLDAKTVERGSDALRRQGGLRVRRTALSAPTIRPRTPTKESERRKKNGTGPSVRFFVGVR